MTQPEFFLLDDVCRLCWNRNADRELFPKFIVTQQKPENTLASMVKYCLDLDFAPDSYPKKLCETCCGTLEKIFEFKSSCHFLEKKLLESLKDLPDTVKIEEEEAPNYIAKDNIKSLSTTGFSDFETSDADAFTEDILKEESCDNEDTKTVRKKKTKSKTKCNHIQSRKRCNIGNSCDNVDTKIIRKRKTKPKTKYKHKRSPTYCNICQEDMEDKDTFIVHNYEAHGILADGQYKCFGCDKKFKSRKTRLGHEVHFCKGLKDGYKCSLCHRNLPSRKMNESHMRDHKKKKAVELPEDLFKCRKCELKFKTKEHLSKHMSDHTGNKKYMCESCGREFTRQDYLYKHQLTHTGVKQHECDHCGLRFRQRSTLTIHVRKHTGERPYRCDVCPQRCVSSSNLRAHQQRHLGIKTYECAICAKKFGYKISLEEHMASNHGRSQSYPCQHCGAIYSRTRALRRHLLAKHGNDTKDTALPIEKTVLPTECAGKLVEKTVLPTEKDSKLDQDEFFLKIVSANDKVDVLKDVAYELKSGDAFVMDNGDQVFVV